MLEQKGQVCAENPESLSEMGQLWLVLALFIGVRQMEKKVSSLQGALHAEFVADSRHSEC